MNIQDITGKKVLILGYGKEGRATEEYLKKTASPAVLDITDQSMDPSYLSKQNGYDLVIKTPGINKKNITVPYTTATNIFFAACKNRIIGVTGTKGKSTTASLIHHILTLAGKKSHLVGNIGNPALETLLRPVGPDDVFVMELSSYQLDDLQYSPHISVILNLFPEHMNYHGSVQNYYEAKKRIVAHVRPEDYFIYNSRYPELLGLAEKLSCKSVPFDDMILPDGSTRLQGEHNRDNIRAALTVCHILGITDSAAYRAVQTFQPLSHRLEYVGTFEDIQFYDDAISTTPESTLAALEALGDVGTIFLGGLDRGYDYRDLVKEIQERRIANVVLFPESGDKIKELLEKPGGWKPHLLETKNMKEAVLFGYEHTPKGSICLLSTAAPSYSIWKNFEEKGDLFKQFVREYAQKPSHN